MDEKIYKVISELIEHSCHAGELLIGGEIALNDGNLEMSQKLNIDAQNLLNTMIKDIFEETRQILNTSCDKVDEYDLPNTLTLAQQLAKLSQNAASLIGVVLDKQNSVIQGIVTNKILTHINTIIEIYNSIFNN